MRTSRDFLSNLWMSSFSSIEDCVVAFPPSFWYLVLQYAQMRPFSSSIKSELPHFLHTIRFIPILPEAISARSDCCLRYSHSSSFDSTIFLLSYNCIKRFCHSDLILRFKKRNLLRNKLSELLASFCRSRCLAYAKIELGRLRFKM